MTDEVPLDTLRQVLALVFPMQATIVVGVGRGQGLADFRAASSLLVIDARAECIEALQKQFSHWTGHTAVRALIAGQTGSAHFHLASKPDESSLIPPEALQPLWRNLTTRTVEHVEAFTLPDLLAQLELTGDRRCNWLVVDCLPALPVLEGAGHVIDDVEVLELRCVRDETIASEQGASLTSIKRWLEPLGFRLVLEAEETHPQLCKAIFCRDLRKLGDRVSLQQKTIAELQASYDLGLRALTTERDTLAQAKVAADKLAAERRAQLDALAAERKQLTAACDALTKEKAALTAERDGLANEKQALSAERALLTDLDTRFKQQAEELNKLRKFTESSVKKHVGSATRQLEASLSLQRYFATGELLDFALDKQLWPLSPDFSRYLVDLIEINDYDLIIEFGAGFTTALIALLLARRASRRAARPVTFVSFEHLEPQVQQARASLQRAGLGDLVQVELTPLEDWQGQGDQHQRFYTCASRLAELAKAHAPAGLRVLVLAQGPLGAEDPHARYPAGPSVFAHFAGAHIDFLLPGCTRDDEMQIVERWQAEMANAGLHQTLTERLL